METVLIVEDDALHRQFLRTVLETSVLRFNHIIEAEDGEKGTELALAYHPDAVILDLQIPKRTGVDVAKSIWARWPDTPTMFWSNYSDEAYVRGITRVAPPSANYGYLLKTSSRDALERAIVGVFRDGQNIVDREISGVQKQSEDRLSSLTDAEYETLLDIALGFTDSAIARRHGVSIRTVQGRLQNLYGKLELSEVPQKDGAAIYNRRNRAVAVALISRKINGKTLEMAEDEYEYDAAHTLGR
jgi:DNA-binding NarL/FixJ family response regulator